MTKVLEVDNSIKGSVQFQFNESISYTALNMIIMAIRRSQIGYYSLFCDSAATNRGLVLPATLQCFVEGVLDVYHSYLSCPCNMLQEEPFFYLRGISFIAMFTHDKSFVTVDK